MNMNQTYCGKTCETCPDRERLGCPGCKYGPGRPGTRDGCTIAACCQEKNHESCASCTEYVRDCYKCRRKNDMPSLREEETRRNVAQKARRMERVGIMNKYLPLLFGVILAQLIPSAYTEFMAEGFPGLKVPMLVLDFLLQAAMILIYYKMAVVEGQYRTAAYCLIVTWLIDIASAFPGSEGRFATIVTLVNLPIALYGQYSIYKSHEAVLCDVDSELGGKWATLWKIYIRTFGCACAIFLLLVINATLGLIGLLAVMIAIACLSIAEVCYLYKTMQAFKEAGR